MKPIHTIQQQFRSSFDGKIPQRAFLVMISASLGPVNSCFMDRLRQQYHWTSYKKIFFTISLHKQQNALESKGLRSLEISAFTFKIMKLFIKESIISSVPKHLKLNQLDFASCMI
ncbi:hypothetical protein FGO68_gene16375 [Halteria grandinella]|uniref:Uncharacterized protein n=1 Tax=Halteria grandinella TaxID=5974 RepID=A0A8J8NF98_HALGN|nr:hypothetical protein FGO68_gene16375 [Halteria grandinella]